MRTKDRYDISGRKLVWDFVISYCKKNNGTPPSTRMIGKAVHFGPTTVHYHLHVLKALGAVKFTGSGKIIIIGATWTPPEEKSDET